ncbi:MAG: hypothetical protein ACI9OJ_003373, partial [Myxococcota bacterium]
MLLARLRDFASSPPLQDLEAYAEFEIMGDATLPPEAEHMLPGILDGWLCFDLHAHEDGRTVAELFLESHHLQRSEVAFLGRLSAVRLRLWEVTSVNPGASIELRDLLSDRLVRVRERTLSKTVQRWSIIVGRVIEPGLSGQPEIETGLLAFPPVHKDALLGALREQLNKELAQGGNLDETLRDLPRRAAAYWLTLFEPPELVTTSGEPLSLVQARYAIGDPILLRLALNRCPMLEGQGEDAWLMVAPSKKPGSVVEAQVFRQGAKLVVAGLSQARVERAREVVEAAAGDALRYEATVLEDPTSQEHSLGATPLAPELDESVRENIRRQIEAQWSGWCDEEVPALDGLTPRAAVSRPAYRGRIVQLLKEFEHHYEGSLGTSTIAPDPTWVWNELDLTDHSESPRSRGAGISRGSDAMEPFAPGISALASELSSQLRPEVSPADAVPSTDERLSDFLSVQRFVRQYAERLIGANSHPDDAVDGANLVAAHLQLLVSWELHYRKRIEVSPSLAFLMHETELSAEGRALRLPFPSFLLEISDRESLGMYERLLAEDGSAIGGHLLHRIGVYVCLMEVRDDGRLIRLGFLAHGPAAAQPNLMVRDLFIRDDDTLDDVVNSRVPGVGPETVDPVFRSHRLGRIVRLVLGSILYATSAGAERNDPDGEATP